MTEKKDFLSELAKEVEQKKKGTREKIDTIDDYQSEHVTKKASSGIDDEFGYPQTHKKEASAPVPEQKPIPQPVFKQEEPEEDEETETEEAYGEDGSPDSFQEESLTKIEKPKRVIKKSFIVLMAVVAIALGILVWYLNFAPKIAMPDFVNQTLNDVAGWAKQNKIDNTYKILICRRGLTEPCFDGDTINLRRRAQAISFKPITVQMHKLVLGTVISSKSKDQHHERKANDSLFFKEENSLG